MKNITLFVLLLVLPFCFGCSSLFSGVDFPAFPVKSKEFDNQIGKRYKVIRPLVIAKLEDSWGVVLVTPDFNGRKIVEISVGSIIVIDHVSMSRNIVSGKFYSYIGRFEDRNIFRGKFDLLFLTSGADSNISLKPEYFLEVN